MPVEEVVPEAAAVELLAVGVPEPVDEETPAAEAAALCAERLDHPEEADEPVPLVLEACAAIAAVPDDDEEPAPLADATAMASTAAPVDSETPFPARVALCAASAPAPVIPSPLASSSRLRRLRSTHAPRARWRSEPHASEWRRGTRLQWPSLPPRGSRTRRQVGRCIALAVECPRRSTRYQR